MYSQPISRHVDVASMRNLPGPTSSRKPLQVVNERESLVYAVVR